MTHPDSIRYPFEDTGTTIARNRIEAFYQGKREGVFLFSWWKDGSQYVGSCGTLLKTALQEIDNEEQEALENIHNYM